MFDCQSTTAKIATNSKFPLVTCLPKLRKATCCATHCGSSDTMAAALVLVKTKVQKFMPTKLRPSKPC